VTARTEVLRRRAATELHLPAVAVESRPRVRSWIIFLLAVVVAFFGLIYSRISLDRSAFVLEELEREIAEQEAHLGDLRLEIARLQAPDRVSALAEEMGLVYPAQRISLEKPALDEPDLSFEYRWAQLRSQPVAQR
jgi:cell division protein FtsL